MEVLGAISAASALLEMAITMVGRIRKAYEQQKEFANIVGGHHDELKEIRDIIQLVEEETALRTAAITSQLVTIRDLTKKLIECLNVLDLGDKRPIRKFAHHLVQGSKDQKAIADKMDKLGRAKSSLILQLQVVNVGLTRTVEENIVANVESIKRIDALLQQRFGEGQGLRLAEFLDSRLIQGDEVVALSEHDIALFNRESTSLTADTDATLESATRSTTSRIVVGNVTEEQALQINGPIGEEGWWEVSHLKIRNNRASGKSIQINHGMSMDIFEQLLRARTTGHQEYIESEQH
ncbi:hypothetical protein P280DRAFT_480369 [Massarina eburnea CBS 473.64]|uniref:Uncharacterized protein n=1 Tax=Massarina eburnea CBS 473.64 TaxID=1395130 RepID=A0A6A6S163_9PLEO|nr:hypothetical protein P280DRAFT_480369 [Massarina eburnea CBS 473.64]